MRRPRLDSYPMHLREPVTVVEPGYLENVYARRPTWQPKTCRDHQQMIADLEANLAGFRAVRQTSG